MKISVMIRFWHLRGIQKNLFYVLLWIKRTAQTNRIFDLFKGIILSMSLILISDKDIHLNAADRVLHLEFLKKGQQNISFWVSLRTPCFVCPCCLFFPWSKILSSAQVFMNIRITIPLVSFWPYHLRVCAVIQSSWFQGCLPLNDHVLKGVLNTLWKRMLRLSWFQILQGNWELGNNYINYLAQS